MAEPGANRYFERLAELCGIEPRYRDIWGQEHEVSVETKRAVLAAMGLSAESEADAQQALETRQRLVAARTLPPVQVVHGDGTKVQIEFAVPSDAKNGVHRWRLMLEDGGVHDGLLVPAEFERCARQEVNGEVFERFLLVLPETIPQGYHRLELETERSPPAAMSLIMAPAHCYIPEALRDESRIWGATCQLYALRSIRNWGIGDFTDLRLLVDCCAEVGANLVGLNPLHALFPCFPERCIPYAPSSRLYFNVLYLDVEAVPEFAQCGPAADTVRSPLFQQQIQTSRKAELVDYREVAERKLRVLEHLYEAFRQLHLEPETERGRAFRAFQTREGDSLRRHALFEALQEHLQREGLDAKDWTTWPEPLRHPDSPEVKEFEAAHRERVEYYQYLQWQADAQLQAARKRADSHQLDIGLYQDLAVSIDRQGAEAWADQSLYATGISIGAPPDDFSPVGQDWGLPPPLPGRMQETAYASFIATLRHNMRHAGALRIDHVMGLARLFWVPSGSQATEGAYVRYPLDDLLGILALESQRNRCLVVGEDLGTVPEILRERLPPAGVLSYRLFYFETAPDGAFRAPEDYPSQALVALSTHDLPTMRGYWEGRDIAQRSQLGLYPNEDMAQKQAERRAKDRGRMLDALRKAGLQPEGVSMEGKDEPESTAALSLAMHRYLARSPAKIMMVQLEDVVGGRDQPNLPGSRENYPSWQRKLSIGLEDFYAQPNFQAIARTLCQERRGRAQELTAAGGIFRSGAPRATYRLQLNANFTFRDAAALVPYLAQLGVSHCYLSPYLKARPGSAHGYDIIDHNSLNPEIGDEADLAALAVALRQQAMGQILDIVPNHVGVMGSENTWWLDVLESGPASFFSSFFDIDWNPLKRELQQKLLVPVLGDHYGHVLKAGQLALSFEPDQGAFAISYYEHVFPVDPQEYPRLLGHQLNRLEQRLGATDPAFVELQSLITAFSNLPARTDAAPAKRGERQRDIAVHKRRLAELCRATPRVSEFIAENVRAFSVSKDDPEAAVRLHDLLEAQAYRLAHWRVAADEINYRRFFEINDLAALRMQDERVFNLTHRYILQLIAKGIVQGLRIDHPDGLYDPAQYYRRLKAHAGAAVPSPANSPLKAYGVYLIAEKILAPFEHLREDWPIDGTSGYKFANLVNGLFVDSASEEALKHVYQSFIEDPKGFEEVLYDRKKLIMDVSLAGELNVLANKLSQISESDPDTRDYTLKNLRQALAEIVACFPVYRTYLRPGEVSEADRRYVEWAVAQAKRHSAAADMSVFSFVQDVLLLHAAEGKSQAYREAVIDFAMRFQQYTAPVMAKGLEDTAFYVYFPLASLNEVGGAPNRFGISIEAFHRANEERMSRWPHALLATSTHDSKRSEDVRARINVLSEIPEQWQARLTRWSRLNKDKKQSVNGLWAPSRNDEYLLYQTLLGVWPLQDPDEHGLADLRGRIQDYLRKAAREAKVHTSWFNLNTDYEEALEKFVEALLDTRREKNRFLDDFLPFQRHIAQLGMLNSLSQTLLKLTSPGVPDIYQGTELWSFTLVDPDNRRPVDYGQRQRLLQDLEARFGAQERHAERAGALLSSIADGLAKLYVLWRALQARHESPQLFAHGTYRALAVRGQWAGRVCAFARRDGARQAITVVPLRLWALMEKNDQAPPLGAVWEDTWLEIPGDPPAPSYRNLFTNEVLSVQQDRDSKSLRLSQILRHFPVALLVSTPAAE